jgi:hypothetical protein
MSDRNAPDEERDAVLDRLLTSPDNKVGECQISPMNIYILTNNRSALTVRVKTRSGPHPILVFSYVTIAHHSIEIWEFISLL